MRCVAAQTSEGQSRSRAAHSRGEGPAGQAELWRRSGGLQDNPTQKEGRPPPGQQNQKYKDEGPQRAGA